MLDGSAWESIVALRSRFLSGERVNEPDSGVPQATPPDPASAASPSLQAEGALAEADAEVQHLLSRLYQVLPVYAQGGDPQKRSAVLKAVSALTTSFPTHDPAEGGPSEAMRNAVERGANPTPAAPGAGAPAQPPPQAAAPSAAMA